MPNFTTHAIMASDMYKSLINDVEVPIDEDKLRRFSVGQDYTVSNVPLFNITHNKNTRLFFITLINYIVENKLYEDSDIMTYLYGQIAHYALDSTVHPLVYAQARKDKRRSILSSHHIIEFYMDDYLAHKKQNVDYNTLSKQYFDKTLELSKNIRILINDIYIKCYGAINTSAVYMATNKLLQGLIYLTNIDVANKTVLDFMTDYEGYYKLNNVSSSYLLNQEHEMWVSPFSGEKSDVSFDDLYKKSIDNSLEMCTAANNYIYGDRNGKKLIKVFKNNSYDTGIDCKYGKVFKY